MACWGLRTGRWLGEGGMARPSFGGRETLLLEPGIGGLNNGAGDAMLGQGSRDGRGVVSPATMGTKGSLDPASTV